MNKTENTIVIYKQKNNKPTIDVRLENETVWLNAHLIASLLGVNRPAVVKHIGNIYKTGELNEKSTCSIMEQVAADGKKRKMNFYNLDMIISIGYRVNSKTATQFRIWATNTLRDHLVKGYTINEKRLREQGQKYRELQNSVKLLENVLALDEITQEQARGIIEVVTDYAYALDILDQYDFKKLSLHKTTPL